LFGFIARRIGVLIVILFGSSYLLYNLQALSGDPLADFRTSRDPEVESQIKATIEQLRLDVPAPLRYFIWLRGVLGIFVGQPDFGKVRTGEPVGELLIDAIPVTIRLVFGATIIAILLGITIGVVTALRQYSRFDYSMTFVAFLMFSLPIFWVAVLLKEFMAIQFNNFLSEPNIPTSWIIGISAFIALFFGAILGRSRRTFWIGFLASGLFTAVLLALIDARGWILEPGIGPVIFALLALLIAFGVTQISMGVGHKPSLYASLSVAVVGAISYFPMQSLFKRESQVPVLFGGLVVALIVAGIATVAFARIDRGPVYRTASITAFIIGIIMIVDKLMQTWGPYVSSGEVQYRPVPTIGERNPLIETNDFWVALLDTLLHMFLPTIALTLIGFAGYVRYTRGTLLDVLNQDYIRTARAKGLNERTVIMRHAFRNTMIPIVTLLVVDFASVVGGALITENVFAWRGMGTLFRQAIGTFDLNLLMGIFFVTATLALVANLVADLLYSALDPRVRVGSGKS